MGRDFRRPSLRQCEAAYNIPILISNERRVEYQRLRPHQERRVAFRQYRHLFIGQGDIPDANLANGTRNVGYRR